MNSSSTQRTNSNQTLIEKIVRLEYQSSPHQEMFKVYLPYLTNTREINFGTVLKDIDSHGKTNRYAGYPLDNSQIFYWDYNRKMFVYVGNYPFKQECLLRYQNFQEKIVHLRVRRLGKPAEVRHDTCRQNVSSAMEIEGERNKQEKRVKERSIQEVIEKVGLWRRLYEAVDLNGKKIHTLESAAREVGIAKKTLDDYFMHLRLAEKYNFDFKLNRQAKIGVLRNFVRQSQKSTKVEQPLSSMPSTPLILTTDKSVSGSAAIKAEFESSGAASSDEESQAYLFHREDSFSD